MQWLEDKGIDPQRITTGLALLAAVVVIGWIDNFFLMWLVFGGLYLLAFYEANKLFGIENNTLYAYAAILWLVAGFYPYPDDLFFIAALVFASVLAYTKELKFKYFYPFIYPTAGFLFMLTLYNEYGVIALFWLLVIVAGTDVGAYVVGKSIGKTRFSETSPNKTLEGVIGGVVIATLLGFLIGVNFVDIDKAIVISLLSAIAAVFGDLFESYLKRRANVKDSGDILPGHGGILDRVDGYLFSVIIMLVLLRGLV
ncbi:MAG: CDP-archaeol synthase [Campylobacterales bacterium]|nr:CDP-archaeol synthase [Campylobacterales bacterium]